MLRSSLPRRPLLRRPLPLRVPRHANPRLPFPRHSSTKEDNAPRKQGLLELFEGALAVAFLVTFFYPTNDSRVASTKKNAPLSPEHFTPVSVVSTEVCSDPNTRIMTLKLPPRCMPSIESPAFQPIWSIYVKDDDIQVERPFTPLEGLNKDGSMKFWVKKYDNGEVGRWLHSKIAGDMIEIRGAVNTWPWKVDEWDEVIMISGGTGITPFYQLLHKELLSQTFPSTRTRFTLLHSSRRPTELPPPEIMEPLVAYSQSQPDKLSVSLFVDSKDGGGHPAVPSSSLTVGRIGKNAIERAMLPTWGQYSASDGSQEDGAARRVIFLVCGPESMITAIAGPYGRNFSQGDIGGVLGDLGYGRDSVWKL